MGSQVAMSFLITIVFGDVVEIISPDDDGPLHFVGDDNALEDLAPDGDVAGEGTFFIDVVAFDGLLGGLEAKTHVLVVPHTS